MMSDRAMDQPDEEQEHLSEREGGTKPAQWHHTNTLARMYGDLDSLMQ